MTVNVLQACTKTMLNHLHSPANAQDRQIPVHGQIEKRCLSFIALRSIAAAGDQIVAPVSTMPLTFPEICNAASTELGIGIGINPHSKRNFTQT